MGSKSTAYVRDAQGNVMAVYENGNTDINSNHLSQIEVDLYGSSRLGLWQANRDVEKANWWLFETNAMVGTSNGIRLDTWVRGRISYELSNHLGNVLVTISDKKKGIDGNNDGTIENYESEVVAANDYYPFGSLMPGRKFSGGSYRYGFNGKENDNDVKGEGNQQDYGMRIYDTRLGKFLSVDPLTSKFPYYSPYQFAGNNPVKFIDLDGAEPQSNPADAQKIIDDKRKTLQQSSHYSSVTPASLLDNLEANIKNPERFCQGYGTNFCGTAQIATELITRDPVGYVKLMTDIYSQASGEYNNGVNVVNIDASGGDITNAAGNLKYPSKYPGTTDLTSNPADQILLLGIANSFKDWLNNITFSGPYSFNKETSTGSEKENVPNWAGTSFGKFESLGSGGFLGYSLETRGSTLSGNFGPLRGMTNDQVVNYFNGQLNKGDVTIFRSPWESVSKIPTHFIRIHGISLSPDKKSFILDQWDYGKRQSVTVDADKFKAHVNGIATFILPTKK
ncbi:MAG: RHS repeat-associated core domain-containing protein [Bacteroidota bacterium]